MMIPRRFEPLLCSFKRQRASMRMFNYLVKYPRARFSKFPNVFRGFGWHNSPCIYKTNASWGTKLCGYFNFYSFYNVWKDQLYRINWSEFYEWPFGPEECSVVRAFRETAWPPAPEVELWYGSSIQSACGYGKDACLPVFIQLLQ